MSFPTFLKLIIYKTMVKKKEEKKEIQNDKTFLDKTGKRLKLNDIVTQEECWLLRREKKWILTHSAIKKIAILAGISPNFKVEESKNITPSYSNELEHVVRVTITCTAIKKNKQGCVHGPETELTITGEANRMSTPNRGRGYLRKMAEKRAFDIAVLEHLGLYSSIYSEEEAEKFEQKKEPNIMPCTPEFEAITTELNAILAAKTTIQLKKIAKKIKAGVKIKKYSIKQTEYLRTIYANEYGKKNSTF